MLRKSEVDFFGLVTGFFSKLPLRCPPEAYIAM
jgi:hypothetical protein